MYYFWKWITYLGGIPGIIILMIPIFFFPTVDQGPSLVESGGIKYMFIGWLLFVSLILSWSAGMLTKLVFFKDRPVPLRSDTRWRKIYAGTFPSLHTIVVTISAMTVFWGVVYFGFPQYIFLIYVFIAFSVALSRIELQKHYPTDVLFGFIYAVVASFITLYGILPLITDKFNFIELYGF